MENQVNQVTDKERIKSLETRCASLELRLTNIEGGMPEFQNNVVNISVGLGAVIKSLIDKNILEEKDIKERSEKIHNDMLKEYDEHIKSSTQNSNNIAPVS